MRRVIVSSLCLLRPAIAGYVFFNGERKVPVRYRTVAVERGRSSRWSPRRGTINPITTVQVGESGVGDDRKSPRGFQFQGSRPTRSSRVSTLSPTRPGVTKRRPVSCQCQGRLGEGTDRSCPAAA